MKEIISEMHYYARRFNLVLLNFVTNLRIRKFEVIIHILLITFNAK